MAVPGLAMAPEAVSRRLATPSAEDRTTPVSTGVHSRAMSGLLTDDGVTRGRGRAPAGSAALAVKVLLVSLTMLFGAGIVAYVAARTGGPGGFVHSGAGVSRIQVPVWFWLSTFVVLVSGVTLEAASTHARADRPERAREWLRVSDALGWLFLVLQAPGLYRLVETHRDMAQRHVLVYALVLFLVILHGLHVTGGLIPMTAMAAGARRNPLGAARSDAIRTLALYWHYLAVVWLVLFNMFLLLG